MGKTLREDKRHCISEVKEEFREFRVSVTGELSGFRLAIESLNGAKKTWKMS